MINTETIRIELPENNVILIIFDKDKKDNIGHITYSVSDEIGDIGRADIYGKYQGKGIFKSYIYEVLCDLKCMGAKRILLDAENEEAQQTWEHIGFKETGNGRQLEIKIPSNKNCNCICKKEKFKNEIIADSILHFKYPNYESVLERIRHIE